MAAAVAYVVVPMARSSALWVIEMALREWVAVGILGAVLAFRGGAVVFRQAWFRTSRYILVCPPTWVAVALGLSSTFVLFALDHARWRAVSDYPDMAVVPTLAASASLAFLVLTGVASIVALRRHNKLAPVVDPPTPARAQLTSVRELRDWIASDEAISSDTHDLFGHAIISRRVAERVSIPLEASAPTIAVVGPLGAGKTSIRRMVEHAVRHNQHVRIVPFSAWPFETPSAVVEGLLGAIVKGIQDELPASAIAMVPTRYVSAIEGAAGSWAWLVQLATSPEDPAELLARIDRAAAARQLRIVLWMEDLERFAPDDFPESEGTRERLAPVRALLYELQQLKNVTVVVASTSIRSGFDLDKVAHFVELLHAPERGMVTRVLHGFRRMLDAHEGQLETFDPAPATARAELSLANEKLDPIEAALRSIGRPEHERWGPALTVVSGSPRSLKQGLRTCDEICAELRGEIDLDHALAASLMRAGLPAVFEYVVSNVDRIRATRDSRSTEKADPWDAVVAEIRTLVPNARTAEAAVAIVDGLFRHSREAYPQGFALTEPTDYWRRYLARARVPPESSDQRILRSIENARRTGADEDLAEDCFQHSERVAPLALRLPQALVRSLLNRLLPRWTSMAYENWGDEKPPGFICVWGLALTCAKQADWDGAEAAVLVKEYIASAIGHNLAVVEALVQYYGSSDSAVRDLMDEPQRHDVRQYLVRSFVDRYAGHSSELVAVLAPGPEFLLARICFGIDRIRADDFSIPFDDWPSVRAAVLEALEQRPEVMLPQVAFMVTHSTDIDRDNRFSFHADAAGRLLDVDAIKRALGRCPNVVTQESETQRRIAAMRRDLVAV